MGNQKLLVVAVDGTLPKFSFARRGLQVTGLQVTWETIVHDIFSLNYSFAFELRSMDYYDAKEGNKVAVLKFDASKKYAFIYGWVTSNKDVMYRVCFDQFELNQTSTTTEDNFGSSTCYLLCLPDEIKLKIVESLDGVDLANLGCVCSEFRNMTSDERLWKNKFLLEFRCKSLLEFIGKRRERTIGDNLWKCKFAKAWKEKTSRLMDLMVPVGGAAGAAFDPFTKDYRNFVLKNR